MLHFKSETTTRPKPRWAEHSSQYNSVLLPMAAGTHTLRVERLEPDDDAVGRGLNKFKILDIAVY